MKPDTQIENLQSPTMREESSITANPKKGKTSKKKNEEQQSNDMGFIFMNNPFRNLNAVYTLSSLAYLLLDYRPTGNEKRQLKRAIDAHDYALVKDLIDTIKSHDYIHL